MIVIFIIWIVFILLQPKKKNESPKEIRKIKDFCNIEERKKLKY